MRPRPADCGRAARGSPRWPRLRRWPAPPCGFLFRHTSAVLGTVIGYLVVVEMIGQGVFEWLRPYLLTNAVSAWLAGGWRYFTNDCVTDPSGGYTCQSKEHLISLAWGATELGLAVLTALVLGALVFRRHDVS